MKKQEIKASFTNREMEAIAKMLLSNDGINVDPIVDDLYPNLAEENKSIFRCKIALLLKGSISKFKPFEGFRKEGSAKIIKYRCISESSLLGIRHYEAIEIWRKDKETNEWKQDTEDQYHEVGSIRQDAFECELYESHEEAEKHW